MQRYETFLDKRNNRLIINIFDDILPGYITYVIYKQRESCTGKTGKSSVNIPWQNGFERKEQMI